MAADGEASNMRQHLTSLCPCPGVLPLLLPGTTRRLMPPRLLPGAWTTSRWAGVCLCVCWGSGAGGEVHVDQSVG